MKMGNVLLVANYASDVGYAWWLMEKFWVAIANYCSEAGRDAYLMYPTVNEVPEVIREAPIKTIEHNFADNSLSGRIRLSRILRQYNIDSVYLTDKPYFCARYFWLRSKGIRAIVNHDHKPGERPYPTTIKRVIKSAATRFHPWLCDLYIGVSKFVHDRFINIACLPQERCTYVYNGIHPIDLDPVKGDYSRKEFGFSEDQLIVVTTGRATFYKGIDFLIKCADELINQRGLPLQFLYCGDGPELETFRNMAHEHNLGDRFFFAGYRTDLPSILQSCDIGVQVSTGEAFSLSILEYMSAGLATLVPDNCGNSEAIKNSQTGLLYPPGDHSAFVDTIESLAKNKTRRHALGKAGQLEVEQRFRIEDAQANLVNRIRGIL